MYVCICRQVTDSDVRQAIAEGACTLKQLCQKLPIGMQCGRCCTTAQEMLQECSLTKSASGSGSEFQTELAS